MRLEGQLCGVTDWANVPASSHPGRSGTATAQTRHLGDIQLRLVSYSSGYEADDWCEKGHIVFVVSGSLTIEHQDGGRYILSAGMSYHVADGEGAPHRLVSNQGGSIFVID